MDKHKQLEKLAERHGDWVDITKSFFRIPQGDNDSDAEDVVQDAYLKIYDRLSNGADLTYGEDSVNDFYMYMTLRSVFVNTVKKKSVWNGLISDPYQKDEGAEYKNEFAANSKIGLLQSEPVDMEKERAYSKLMDKIWGEINTWDFYSRNLFQAYFTTKLSLTKLSDEVGIGRSSLYNSIRLYRQIIRDHFSEDVEDFYNGDYDKI